MVVRSQSRGWPIRWDGMDMVLDKHSYIGIIKRIRKMNRIIGAISNNGKILGGSK